MSSGCGSPGREQPRDIVLMVVGSGARVTVAGVIAGLAGALAATRLLSSLLF